MQKLAFVALASLSSLACAAIPTYTQIVGEVSQANYHDYLYNVLDTQYGDNRRYSVGAPQLTTTRDSIVSHLQAQGLTVTQQSFSYNNRTGVNVLTKLPGRVSTGRTIVIGAHYDSTNSSGNGTGAGQTPGAPGADDNASGVAAMMEAARVLSKYQFNANIVFAGWDAEEVGLIGSKRYVTQYGTAGIATAVAADMIAWNDPTAPNRAILNYQTTADRTAAQGMASAMTRYSGGITASVVADTYDSSDYAPFSHAGVPSFLLFEGSERNPNYHRWNDSTSTPNYIDDTYATKMTRGLIGYLAEQAGLLIPGDSSLDNTVDFTDLVIVAANYNTGSGKTWVTGDYNADGSTDFNDLVQLASNYNGTPAQFEEAWARALSTVPEPTSLAVIGLLGVALRRRR